MWPIFVVVVGENRKIAKLVLNFFGRRILCVRSPNSSQPNYAHNFHFKSHLDLFDVYWRRNAIFFSYVVFVVVVVFIFVGGGGSGCFTRKQYNKNDDDGNNNSTKSTIKNKIQIVCFVFHNDFQCDSFNCNNVIQMRNYNEAQIF